MSTLTCTIGGTSYSVKVGGYGSLQVYDALEVRGSLDIAIEDYSGTASFVYGQPVVLSDSVLGTLFQGFVGTDKPTKPGPASTTVEHYLTCFDKQYLVDKRTNYSNYLGWYAGDIVVDFVRTTLAAEGVTVAAAMHRDTTDSDFNTGLLSGTVGTLDTNDGCLELAKAGSDVTISETTTANFSTGTLTNVQAVSNTLTPTTVNALKAQLQLTEALANNALSIKFWSGSMTVGSSDTLHYDIWISSTSPASTVAIDLTFSDGSFMSTAGLVDQNSLNVTSSTDLSGAAEDQWYSRSIALTGLNGKVINAVTISGGGSSAGTYTAYIKNCYLQSQSGSPFFGTSTTAPNVNPPLIVSNNGYSAALTSVTVVAVWDTSYRISSGYSIDAVKLVRSSLIFWTALLPSGANVSLYASYDGGNTYAQCTNNSALPALPAGSNVAGLTLTLKEVFEAGTDPTVLPSLTSVNASLVSAPNPTSAKSDVVTSFYNSTTWNAGTYSSLGLASDNVGITPVIPQTRNWNDGLITNQTFFPGQNVTESASSNAYVQSISSLPSPLPQASSRLDFLGSVTDFVLDIDVKMSAIAANNQLGVVYRQTYWDTGNNTFAYMVSLNSADLVLLHGSNSSSGALTQIGIFSGVNPSANTSYHIKIDVSGNTHKVYWNHSGSANITVTDSTYPNAGYIGLQSIITHTGSFTWDNLSVNIPASSGTWVSPSTSINSLGTCGGSAIAWTEMNTAASSASGNATATIQTSIDGGSTYQTCTNGGIIPGLTSGVSVSGKSVLTKVLLTTTPGGILPEVARLFWRVLGAYPGSSGTRSTAPLGNDTVISRPDQSGWGTAFDSQTWTKTGTATDSVSSNQLLITNTTGDVHERLGSRTDDDEETTVEFQLSASTITGGAELRYVDANNLYRLAVSTTAISIIKIASGASSTLATVSASLSTGVWYWLRFRVVGSTTISLYGRVWASGTLEDQTTWTVTASD